jgi:23S rRNA (cytidine1920-2'-O)/16S rRNA (cytidine1409-2'-O)-methyltransferase
MPQNTIRLDAALVNLGLYESREQARRALLAGEIELNGRRDMKPGWPVTIRQTENGRHLAHAGKELTIHIRERMPYVSRGGLKLAAALDAFTVDPAGLTALDIGASTGGFTDCLLQRGAGKVYAVDCGRGQLHDTLRKDSRVISMEKTNARFLTREQVPDIPGIIVADVSFISLKLLLPVMNSLGGPGTIVITLVKPQFEVGPEHVQRGGVVTDPEIRRQAVDNIRQAMEQTGWHVFGAVESPITGPAGNHEYLLGARM